VIIRIGLVVYFEPARENKKTKKLLKHIAMENKKSRLFSATG
jgi:hypothetical protein